MTTQNAITWPERYLPGTGDNFVSNEVVVPGLTAARVWRSLTDTSQWEGYYDNVADISFPEGGGPVLEDGLVFSFGTFGFPPLAALVTEFQAPADGVPGRLSWTAKQDGTPEEKLDVLHAWLVEDWPAAGSASSPRRRRSDSRPPPWPASARTRCSSVTRHGWTG